MAAPLLDFTEIVEKRGLSPDTCRLLRHDRRALAAWAEGRDVFGAFVSYQRPRPSPYFRAEIAFQFVPGPTLDDGDQSALFVGAHRIVDRFPLDRTMRRLPRLHHPSCDEEYRERDDPVDAFDLDWLADWDDLSQRVLVRWGSPASSRAWSQWASNRKEVVEVRRTADEPDFPGFAKLALQIDELPTLPPSWRAAIASVGGVYLLVCPDTGEQYVGSATGEGGFWARWSAYAADGHGGNVRLVARGRRNYAVSILEVASPDMAPADVIARESRWKTKLGSRAHGLNAN